MHVANAAWYCLGLLSRSNMKQNCCIFILPGQGQPVDLCRGDLDGLCSACHWAGLCRRPCQSRRTASTRAQNSRQCSWLHKCSLSLALCVSKGLANKQPTKWVTANLLADTSSPSCSGKHLQPQTFRCSKNVVGKMGNLQCASQFNHSVAVSACERSTFQKPPR